MNEVLQGAVVFLIIIQSLILILLTVALIIIFYQIKKVIDKVNDILSTAEDIAHGVRSATTSGLANLLGKGLREAVNNFTKKRAKK